MGERSRGYRYGGIETRRCYRVCKKGLVIEDGSQDQEIKTLIGKLRFPLGIQQAIAYIQDQRLTREFSIDDYLEEYG